MLFNRSHRHLQAVSAPTQISQMQFDDRVRKDIRNALIYPMFLIVMGMAATLFIFLFVVPRFAGMMKGRLQLMPPFSRGIFLAGMFLRDNIVSVAGLGVVLIAALLAPRLEDIFLRGMGFSGFAAHGSRSARPRSLPRLRSPDAPGAAKSGHHGTRSPFAARCPARGICETPPTIACRTCRSGVTTRAKPNCWARWPRRVRAGNGNRRRPTRSGRQAGATGDGG